MRLSVNRRTGFRLILIALLWLASASLYNPGNAHSELPPVIENKPIVLVFDLGGVFIETNYPRCLWFLGIRSLMSYSVSFLAHKLLNRQAEYLFSIKRKFYRLLNTITHTAGNPYNAHDEDGNMLPQLLCDWLCGAKTNTQLRTLIKQQIAQHPEWFSNHSEQLLLERMANMIFTPESFIKTRSFNPDGLAFIKECKANGHTLYILSNWDPESFAYMVKENPEFFSYFDQHIISGHTGALKPCRAMYEQFIDHPEIHWVIIDDQQENIDAARSLGLDTIICKRKKGLFFSSADFSYIKEQLKQITTKAHQP